MAREVVIWPVAHVFDAQGNEIDRGRPEFVRAHPEGGSTHLTIGAEMIWHRDAGWMQLGIMVPKDALLATADRIRAEDAQDGTDVSDTVSFFADIDRSAANDLIRTARRARNAAFGADE